MNQHSRNRFLFIRNKIKSIVSRRLWGEFVVSVGSVAPEQQRKAVNSSQDQKVSKDNKYIRLNVGNVHKMMHVMKWYCSKNKLSLFGINSIELTISTISVNC